MANGLRHGVNTADSAVSRPGAGSWPSAAAPPVPAPSTRTRGTVRYVCPPGSGLGTGGDRTPSNSHPPRPRVLCTPVSIRDQPG
jgi:hypothetical protein